jgi:cell division initiation protein
MNVSPLDLRQQRFRNAFRGFDKIEVTSFLLAVADDYEQALRDTDRLRQDVSRMEAALLEHRESEKSLKVTLMTAQKLADDLKANAEEEARRVLHEAQGRADLILQQSQGKLDDIQYEIEALKLKRRQVEVSLEGTIQTLRHTLDFVRDQETREDKVLFHRPRLVNLVEHPVPACAGEEVSEDGHEAPEGRADSLATGFVPSALV